MSEVVTSEVSRRIATAPTGLSLLRPILAGMAIYDITHGRPKRAAAEAAASGLTDFFDGKLARWIEKRWPGWGVTEFGAVADQAGDSAALTIGGVGWSR